MQGVLEKIPCFSTHANAPAPDSYDLLTVIFSLSWLFRFLADARSSRQSLTPTFSLIATLARPGAERRGWFRSSARLSEVDLLIQNARYLQRAVADQAIGMSTVRSACSGRTARSHRSGHQARMLVYLSGWR